MDDEGTENKQLVAEELAAINVYAMVGNHHGSEEVVAALERLVILTKKLQAAKLPSMFTVAALEKKLLFERTWKPFQEYGMNWFELLKIAALAADWDVRRAVRHNFIAVNPEGSVIDLAFDHNTVSRIHGLSASNLVDSLVDWKFPAEPSESAASAFIEHYTDW